MSRTGFYDKTQDLYLPKDSTTWADLTPAASKSWDQWTSWYQTLSGSTTLEYSTDILDFGYAHKIYPVITITTLYDGLLTAAGYASGDKPAITIEAGNQSDLSDATSIVLTRTSNPDYVGLGSKRYYRVTVNIDSGTNSTPKGFRAIDVSLLTDAIEETIEGFNSASYDDSTSNLRTIPTNFEYSDISFVGITVRSTITDTVVTGVSADGSTVIYYVASGYVNTGYFVGDSGTSTATTSTITTVPLVRLDSTSTDSFTIQCYKPNTAEECDVIADAYIRGLPKVAIDNEGNLVRTT